MLFKTTSDVTVVAPSVVESAFKEPAVAILPAVTSPDAVTLEAVAVPSDELVAFKVVTFAVASVEVPVTFIPEEVILPADTSPDAVTLEALSALAVIAVDVRLLALIEFKLEVPTTSRSLIYAFVDTPRMFVCNAALFILGVSNNEVSTT
jgi:hypothetical protein